MLPNRVFLINKIDATLNTARICNDNFAVFFLDLGFDALDDSLARRNNIKGIVVARVIPGSGADAAGIRGITRSRSGLLLGDVIVAVDGEAVTDNNELYRALDGKKPGQKVPVTLLRKGEKVEVEVSLSEAAPRAR